MLCPEIVDREAEIRAIGTGLDRAASGSGGVLFLAGEAGIGKSRLAREAIAMATERGFHVLVGRATESTVPVPFRPIAEALMKVARAGAMPGSADVASHLPALASLVPEWSRPGDSQVEMSPLILGEALIRLLTPPGTAGTLLVLEDLHWADPETLAIVEYLADNLADTKVLCLGTVRDTEPSSGMDSMRALTARRAATCTEVGRLGDRAVRQMAAACLESDDLPEPVTRLLADCDGLPFAVEEILAAAVSSGQLVSEPHGWQVDNHVTTAVPASIASSVRNRLAALDPAVCDVLSSAAVLGRKFDWTLLPVIADQPEAQVLAALQQAQAVQLIVPLAAGQNLFSFRHSLTRHSILSSLLPPELARRSARAAAQIENAHPGLPGSWCELAAELYRAAGDRVRAAGLLLQLGRHALRQGALSTATTSLTDAHELLGAEADKEPDLTIEIDEALVDALADAGDYIRLRPMADRLIAELNDAGADPRRQAVVMVKVARASCEEYCGHCSAQLTAARAIADRVHDVALASQIDAAAARCAIDSGDLDGAEKLARQALSSAEDASQEPWAAEVAFSALEVLGRRERMRDMEAARAAFERAYQIATDEDFAIGRIRALHELGTVDMLTHGDTGRLLEARALARKSGAVSTTTIIDVQLANTWSLGSDLDRALTAARSCEQGARQMEARRTEAIAINIQALVAAIRGDRRSCAHFAERAEKVVPGDPEVLFSTWGLTRVTASLFLDDLPRALRESEAGIAHGGDTALISPRRAWGYYALLQAIFDKDVTGALELARAAGAAVGWNQGYLAYAEAVMHGRAGDRRRAAELAKQGSALLTPYAPWWDHLARRLAAPAALKDGWGDPVGWMREAAAEFESCGQPRLASACRGILRRAGERVPRSGRGAAQVPPQMRRLGITSREMDVFLLVARGFSNSDIAERLFISPKTVETHVASLVTKTGQTGRRELVAHAARFVPR
jgi:DNA-binding CsgD family transcriptional regulator/tetratricopeptide (TPR) repeat protein